MADITPQVDCHEPVPAGPADRGPAAGRIAGRVRARGDGGDRATGRLRGAASGRASGLPCAHLQLTWRQLQQPAKSDPRVAGG